MKKRIKRLIAGISVLAVAAGSVILSAFGLNAGAASSEPTVTSFATKNQLMTVFDLDGNNDTVGLIYFGIMDYTDNRLCWYIAGKDNGISGDNVILLVKDRVSLIDTPYYYSRIPFLDIREDGISKDETNFTLEEQALMNTTRIDSSKDKLLYSLKGTYGGNAIYAGTNNNVKVDLTSYPTTEFWLRTEYDSDYALCVRSHGTTVDKAKKDTELSMRMAVDINLTNVLFASSARTDPSAVKYEKTNASTGMILRLNGSSKKIGTVKYYDVNGYQGVAAYKDKDASGTVSLVIQGNNGTDDWYYSVPVNDYAGVKVEEIESALGISGVSLDKCKIWLETTIGKVAYATSFASEVQSLTDINTVAFNIDTPVGGSALDTAAEVNRNVTTDLTYDILSDISWSPSDTNAYYNTAYTASVKVTPRVGYSFSSSTVARVNSNSSNNGTVTKNSDGTLTVKYTFGKTAYGNPQASDFTFTPPTNLVYDGNAKTASVTSGVSGMGAVTAVKYYKNGTRLSSAPVDAGEYTVKIDVANGNKYNSASDVTSSEWKFTIAKATPVASNFTFTPPSALVYDGTKKSATMTIKSGLSGFGSISAVKYRKVGESTISATAPDSAGTYEVLIDVSSGNNYASVTNLTSSGWKFTIEKAVPTSDDFIFTPPSNLVYDGSRKNARVTLKSGLSGMGGITYRYYWVNGSYTGAVAPGPVYTYIVKISITEGENFTSATDVTSEDWTFTITRATTTVDKFTFTPPSSTVYDGNAKVATVSVNSNVYRMGDITVKYFGSDGVQLSSAPTDVGSYTVKIDVAQGGNYSAASDLCLDSWKFDITAATPAENDFTFAAPENLVYDDSAKSATVELKPEINGMGSFTVKYYKDGSAQGTTEAPVSPGTYKVKLDIEAGTNYTAYSDFTFEQWSFTIDPAVPTADDFTFTPPSDLIVNGSEKAVSVSKKAGIKGMGEFTVKYYDAGGNLLTSAPSAPGAYTVKVDVAVGTNYTSAVDLSDNWGFIISDITESDDFTFTPPASLVYDGTVKDVVVAVKTGVSGMGDFVVGYYDSEGNKLSSAPKNVGSYTVKIDVMATAYYTAAQSLTADDWRFTITKATPATEDFDFTLPESLVYDDTVKGVTIAPKANINGIGDITVKYYNDGEQLDSAPIFPGTYTVRIDVAEGSNYTAIDDLTTLSWKYSIADIVSSTYFTFIAPSDLAYNGNGKQAVVKAKSGITGMGAITVKYYDADGAQLSSAPVVPGTYFVKADIAAGRKYAAATDITSDSWKFTITKGNLTAEGTGKATGKYGDRLSNLVISGLTVKFGTAEIEGEWSLTGSTIVNVGDNGRYTATFAPQENPEYYNPLTAEVTLDIAKADAPEVSDASVNYNWAAVGEKSVVIEGLPSDTGAYGTADFDITDTDGILTEDSVRFDEGNVYFTLDTNTKENIGSVATINVTLPTQNYSDITFKVTINIVAKKNQNAPSACELALELQSNGTYTATITAVEGAEYKFNDGEWGTANTLTGIEHTATVTAYIRMAETSEYNASETVSASRTLSHIYSTEWTVDKEATCTEQGSKSHHCTICGNKKDITAIPMISHSYGEWIVDTSATCTENGSKHRVCSACRKTDTQVITATGHSYSTEWTIDKPATCTEQGSKSHHCTICGNKKDITAIPMISHSYGAWIVDTAATCTEDGSKHRVCSACRKNDTQVITATGHSYSAEWTIDKPATCTEQGSKSHHCTICGNKKDITAIPMISHSYGEWIVDTAATCTEDGLRHRECSVCGKIAQQTITAKGHSYSTEWTVDKEATCTEQGSKSHHCTRCGDKKDITDIPMISHSYGEWIVDTAATCTDDGSKHRVCSACNKNDTQVITATGHSYSTEWTIDKPATCTEQGSKSYHCTICGNKKDITAIPMISHSYGAWIVDTSATCTENGSKHRVCSACRKTDTQVITATGHSYSTEWTVDKAATCTEQGSKSHHCTICGNKKDITSILMISHSYGAWRVDTAATCTDDGSKHRVCSVCSKTDTQVITATGHSYSDEWTIDLEPTCTEQGSKSHHCTICGNKKDITAIPMISHSYGEWIVDTAATCTEDGSKHRVCSACNKNDTKVITATGHSYSTEWTVDKAATCTEQGSKSYHCTICGNKKDITDIPMISHSYGAWIVDTAATCTDDGSKHRVCSVCSKTDTQVISATGHSYSDEWTIDLEPTCTEQGSKSHHCTKCGDKTDITDIPVAEHTYVSKVVYPTYTEKGYTVHTCSVCGKSYNDSYTAKLTRPSVTGLRVLTRTYYSLVICWSKASSADGYTVEKFNGTKWVSVAEITDNKTTTCCVSDLNAATEYKLRVRAYAMSGTKKLYSSNTASVSAYTYPSRVTNLKLTGRTANSLTISWDKNASSDGYLIELYQSGKWVNVTKITNKATTSYRVTGLKAGTAYLFRIRAYVKTGNSTLSSCYTNTIAARTLPAAVTGFKLTARTSTSIKLGWDKNANAGGYIVEQYKNGKWVSVAKLSKATTSYRVTGLKAGATYKFRIKAYTTSGITKLYSGYQTISVKTAN